MTAGRIILGLLAGLALVGANSPADRLARAEREAAKSSARVRQLEQAAQSAVDEAARLAARAALLAGRVQEAEAAIEASEARVALLDMRIAAQRRKLAQRQGKIVDLLAALETLSRRPPALAFVQPGSVRDTSRIALLLDGMIPVIRARTADLREELAAYRTLRNRAAAARTQLAQARTRLEESRQLLARAEQERRNAATDLATKSMLESDRALALSVEARDLKDLMGKLDADAQLRNRLASLPGPIPRPSHIPANALPPVDARVQAAAAAVAIKTQSGLVLPVLGTVTAGFGELSDAGIRSRGLTLHTRAGAQVIAPAAGRIAYAGPFREFGKIVIVEHGDGLTSLLAGLDRLDVSVGQKVAAGGPVGQMGDTQRDLMLEVRQNGDPVNPLPLMSAN